jgi:hypothetical protein
MIAPFLDQFIETASKKFCPQRSAPSWMIVKSPALVVGTSGVTSVVQLEYVRAEVEISRITEGGHS